MSVIASPSADTTIEALCAPTDIQEHDQENPEAAMAPTFVLDRDHLKSVH
jgi:hypothetical protein